MLLCRIQAYDSMLEFFFYNYNVIAKSFKKGMDKTINYENIECILITLDFGLGFAFLALIFWLAIVIYLWFTAMII